MKVVLDTNTIISSYLSRDGPPARPRALWREGAFDVIVSEPILAEYRRALAYPKVVARHHLSRQERADAIAGFREYAILVDPVEPVRVVEADPDDDKLFEAAIAGGAAFIVSGDKKVRAVGEHRGVRVLSPAAFLALLRAERGS